MYKQLDGDSGQKVYLFKKDHAISMFGSPRMYVYLSGEGGMRQTPSTSSLSRGKKYRLAIKIVYGQSLGAKPMVGGGCPQC